MNINKFTFYSLILASIIGATFFALNSNNKFALASDTCPQGNGWTKDESPPFSHLAPAGYIIDQICVKGGNSQNQNGYIFTANTNGVGHTCHFYQGNRWRNGSVSVTGIGTNQGSASMAGECAAISHASFHKTLIQHLHLV